MSGRPCGSVAATSVLPTAPAATVSVGTTGTTGGALSGSTVMGMVIVAESGAPPVMDCLVAVNDTLVWLVVPNRGVQLNSSVPGSNVAPGGKAPTGVTVTVGSSVPCSTSTPVAPRTGGA